MALIATAEQVCLGLRNSVAFVEDERSPQHLQIQLLKNLNDSGNLDIDISRASIHDMDQEVRLAQFLERRTKGSQQFFG